MVGSHLVEEGTGNSEGGRREEGKAGHRVVGRAFRSEEVELHRGMAAWACRDRQELRDVLARSSQRKNDKRTYEESFLEEESLACRKEEVERLQGMGTEAS